mgnify:CR=1 FL=1
MMYHFRFCSEELSILRIFEDPELYIAFNNAFEKNSEDARSRIKDYTAFILSKRDSESGSSLYSLQYGEVSITLHFKENLKRLILFAAISDVFSGKLNVKENILEKLHGSFIFDCVMNKKLLSAFENAVAYSKSGELVSSDTLDELETEFLQK